MTVCAVAVQRYQHVIQPQVWVFNGGWHVVAQRAQSRRGDRNQQRLDRLFACHEVRQPLFDQLRSGNVATLRGWNLKDRDLDLIGEHPEFGEVTMRQLLATWVVHDLSHIAQITRTMARSYTEAVGPWMKYFRVLQRDQTK